jgi:PAS domain S-box-containing protein
MSDRGPSYEELLERLSRAEATLDALRRGEVDVVVGAAAPLVVRLKSLVDENERLSREWQATFDAMPEAIFVLDADLCVLRANRTAAQWFGCPPEQMAGKHCWEIVHGTDTAPAGCALVRMRESLRHEREEVQIGTRWYEVDASPIVEGDRHLVGAVHVFSDITDRKAAREERERLQASLAQSDRLASMGMTAAGVAHEVNNPLSYVLYNLESLAEDLPQLCESMRRQHEELASRLRAAGVAEGIGSGQEGFDSRGFEDAIGRVREAADGAMRIKQITRALGTFSRADSNEMAPVSVQSAIEHALHIAFNEIKYRARVVKDLQPVPAVLATDGKLAQVFLNLIINAAHAINEGHVEHNRIRVRTWTDAGMVWAEVSDTGKGIAPEIRDKVFDPFFTTKGVGSGTGLGLWICRNIVTGLGGEIDFSSEPGRGTTFRVKLPPAPQDWESVRPQEDASVAPAPTVRGRILIVDDEAAVRAAIRRMLGRDHDVVTAESGEAARELLGRDRRFDVILCDLMMPELSGMELHGWLAEVDPALADQVVFITGGAFTPGAVEYLRSAKNLRIEKPFETASLRRLTAELVLAARSKRGGTAGGSAG